jgi:hypothetical protein
MSTSCRRGGLMDYYPHLLRSPLERMPGLYLVPCNIHSRKMACRENVRCGIGRKNRESSLSLNFKLRLIRILILQNLFTTILSNDPCEQKEPNAGTTHWMNVVSSLQSGVLSQSLESLHPGHPAHHNLRIVSHRMLLQWWVHPYLLLPFQ